jgi:hypothetical protein
MESFVETKFNMIIDTELLGKVYDQAIKSPRLRLKYELKS